MRLKRTCQQVEIHTVALKKKVPYCPLLHADGETCAKYVRYVHAPMCLRALN